MIIYGNSPFSHTRPGLGFGFAGLWLPNIHLPRGRLSDANPTSDCGIGLFRQGTVFFSADDFDIVAVCDDRIVFKVIVRQACEDA